MTFFMSFQPTFGAASRSSASLAWNSSRYSSGTRPTSRNDITWPSFIAAPFIVPSAATICSAVSSWRLASAASRLSSLRRATLPARVPICLAACVAASLPTFEERLSREVGIASFLAMSRDGSGPRLGVPCYPAVRSTREPGTMSSRPSGQRTQALWPPS